MKSLREWRISQRLSVCALAELAGVALQTLSDLEHGRRVPNYGTMRLICLALGVAARDVTEFAAAIELHATLRARTP